MRMSIGPGRVNEKPRSLASSCGDDTPRSSTKPSTCARPSPARCSATAPNRPWITVIRGSVAASGLPSA
jgi:hypothetical protein